MFNWPKFDISIFGGSTFSQAANFRCKFADFEIAPNAWERQNYLLDIFRRFRK
jgi:hypothetical protein